MAFNPDEGEAIDTGFNPDFGEAVDTGFNPDEGEAVDGGAITQKIVSSPMSSLELEQFYKENPDLQQEILRTAPSLPSVQSAEANLDPSVADYFKAFGGGVLEGGQEMYGTLRQGLAHVAAPIVASWNKSTGPQGYIGNERSYDSLRTDAYNRAINSEGVPGLLADPFNLVSLGVGGVGERIALRQLPRLTGIPNLTARAAMGAAEGAGYMAASNALDTNRTSNLGDVGYGALLGGITGVGQGVLSNEAARLEKVKASNLAKRAEYGRKLDDWDAIMSNNEEAQYMKVNRQLYESHMAPKYTFQGQEYTDLSGLKKLIAKRPEYAKHGLNPESITDKEAIDFMNRTLDPRVEVATMPVEPKLEPMLPISRHLAGPVIGGLAGLHFSGGSTLAGLVGAGFGLASQTAGAKLEHLANRAYGATVPTIVKIADPTIGALRYPGTRALFELKESLQNPQQSEKN